MPISKGGAFYKCQEKGDQGGLGVGNLDMRLWVNGVEEKDLEAYPDRAYWQHGEADELPYESKLRFILPPRILGDGNAKVSTRAK